MFDFLKNPLAWWRNRRELKKKLAEMRKRDPFIYK